MLALIQAAVGGADVREWKLSRNNTTEFDADTNRVGIHSRGNLTHVLRVRGPPAARFLVTILPALRYKYMQVRSIDCIPP